MNDDALRMQFHNAVIALCERTKAETRYNPHGFAGKVGRVGGYEATCDILNTASNNWEGFTRLFMEGRLDLSVEAMVLNEPWHRLFSRQQLVNARNRLLQVNYQPVPELPPETVGPESDKNIPAPRRPYSRSSVVRDTEAARSIKELYKYRCQVCGTALSARGEFYAEAAHIRPLGSPHDGPDEMGNMLCLCPNHHKLFDLGGYFINDDLTIPELNRSLTVHPDHNIDRIQLGYHRKWFSEGA